MKKEDLKEDIVRSRLASFAAYIADNSKQFIIAVFIVCFVIGGYGMYTASKKQAVRTSIENVLTYSDSFVEADSSSGLLSSVKLKLENILDDYQEYSSGMIASLYLSNAYYKENDSKKVADLLSKSYSTVFNDPLIESSFLETQANIAMNNNDARSIKLLDESLGIDGIYTFSTRFNISKALAYISNEEYSKAMELLNNIEDKNIAASDKNKIEELIAYCNTKY